MRRAAIIATALTAALALSPDASAKTLMDIFGKWNCTVQMYNGSTSGNHTQYYGFGGVSWREGDISMQLDENTVADVSYKLSATVTVNGDTVSETGYAFSKAEGTLNGQPSSGLAQSVTDGFTRTSVTDTTIIYVDDRTLIMNSETDLTACTKLD